MELGVAVCHELVAESECASSTNTIPSTYHPYQTSRRSKRSKTDDVAVFCRVGLPAPPIRGTFLLRRSVSKNATTQKNASAVEENRFCSARYGEVRCCNYRLYSYGACALVPQPATFGGLMCGESTATGWAPKATQRGWSVRLLAIKPLHRQAQATRTTAMWHGKPPINASCYCINPKFRCRISF